MNLFAIQFYHTGIIRLLLSFTLSIFLSNLTYGQYRMEDLDRGLVAIPRSDGSVMVSWRWLGQEPENTSFNIYRNGSRLNSSPIGNRTHWVDRSGDISSVYEVEPIINGVAQEKSAIGVWRDFIHRISLQRPAGGTTPDGVRFEYQPNDLSVADLDGDGQYEIIVKWNPSNAKDNSQSGYTGKVYLDAYEIFGGFMWRIDLGRNIRAGAHYTQFMVYDFDSDGKAEIAVKTADGTIDGVGNVIGSSNADYRNSHGYILSGPEYLTMFNGQTGTAMQTINYSPGRGNVSDWGDSYGNRVDRFLAGVAYLDGRRPSLIMSRGYYTRTVVAAWDWINGSFQQRWVFDSRREGRQYEGQGAHSLTIGDVDGDHRQEIVFGAMTIDDNGYILSNTGLCHGDALHLSDMNPNVPGLEVFMVHESPSCYGTHGLEMHNAATGQLLWSASGEGTDVGRGVAMDIDPRYFGYEAWGSRGGLRSATGQFISNSRPSSINFASWWDGDLLRELLDGTHIDKWNYSSYNTTRLLDGSNYGAVSNNGTKSTPGISADILGDWREEVIWRNSNNEELLLFTTPYESDIRLRTLMHDAQYRVAIAWQNTAYNQPPHPGYYIGTGMNVPAQPNIEIVEQSNPKPTGIVIQENSTGFCRVDGTIDSNHPGYTAFGFANTTNELGSSIEWNFAVSRSGNYPITFRYGNGSNSDRSAILLVNGSQQSAVNFPSTSSWAAWNNQTVSVYLNQGTSRIRLQANTNEGLGNIDYAVIESQYAQASYCPR